MFCPNCGNPVSKYDNFCPNCGKKLREVTTVDVSSSSKQIHNSMDETRVFNPKTLDGIDTAEDIKNIIHAVDEKISENIKKYESQKLPPVSADSAMEQPQERSSNNPSPAFDSSHMSQSELVRRVQEELQKGGYDESKVDQDLDEECSPLAENSLSKESSVKEEKKSLRTLWKNFINEDNDEYSIFSGLNEKAKDKDLEKERNIEVTSTLNTGQNSWEDTMSVPKVVTEEEMEEVEEKVEKQLHSSDSPQETKDVPSTTSVNKSASQTSSALSKKSKKEKTKQTSAKKTTVTEKNSTGKISSALEEKDLSKTSSPVSPLNKLKEKKNQLFSSFSKPSAAKHSSTEQNSVKTTSLTDDAPKKNDKQKSASTTQKHSSFSYSFMDRIAHAMESFSVSVKTFYGKETKILILIGILFTFVPILLAQRKFALSTIVFLALRLVFDVFEYYTPLTVATERGWVETSPEEKKRYATINWVICKLILFVGFFLSPFGGFFAFPLINALTAMPICTLVLSLLSPVIALALYWTPLREKNKVDFLGWYTLLFILLELFFKLIWFCIHFIFNTLF